MCREDAWYALLDMVRIARYYSEMADYWEKLRNAFRITLAASGVGATASLIEALAIPTILQPIIAFIIVIVLLADLIIDPSAKAVKLRMVSNEMDILENELRRSWDEQNFAEIPDIKQRTLMIGSRAEAPINQRIRQRCQEDAYRIEAKRYA